MGKIVIVDDSRLARTFASSCLRKLAHTVEEVDPTSIFDVVKILKDIHPDLLIMDFLMPNCPGTSLARVCHDESELKDMRIIVLTAHHDETVTARLMGMGVSEVVFKPVEPQRLADAVSRVLGI